MKILLIHRYFWPDSPPYASILRTIAEHLAQQGHEVDVFTAQPSYGGTDAHERAARSELLNKVQITRAPLLRESKAEPVRRAINLGLFAGQAFGRILRRRDYDVVMAATTPPILVALAAQLGARLTGSKMIYHMQDIYPEVLAANSGQALRLPFRVLQRVDGFVTRNADRVVVLSTDMRDSLVDRSQDDANVRIINNFVPDSEHTHSSTTAESPSPSDSDCLRVIFAGNLGKFQGLDVVIDAFHDLHARDVDVQLTLLGEGAAEASLKLRAGELLDDGIVFRSRVPQLEAEGAISASDLALVTLNPGVIRTAFPSKTMTYLSSGTPVLAAVEASSELSRLLGENNVGTSCNLNRLELADAIEMFAKKPRPSRETVQKLAHSYASAESRLPQWARLFEELA